MKKFLSITLCFVIVLNSMFSLNVNANDISPQAVVINETVGNNDSLYYAQVIHEDYTVLGTISSLTDVDFYKIVIPETGKANFWLGDIPSGCDYDLYILSSSGSEKYRSDTSNPTNQELISNKPVTKNEVLYIKVTSKSGFSTSLKYKLRVKVSLNSYKHFCQKYDSSGRFNFLDTNLGKTNIRWKTSSTADYKYVNFKEDINLYGCALSSYAMILNNLQKYTTTSYRDIRDGVNSTLKTRIADPVSVCYANIGFKEAVNNPDSPGNYLITSTKDPSDTNYLTIGSGFGVSIKRVEVGTLTVENKKNNIAKYLVDHPEGICAFFSKGSNSSHMIVIKSTTHEAPSGFVVQKAEITTPFMYDEIRFDPNMTLSIPSREIGLQSFPDGDKFIVFDPVRLNSGDVTLTQTWTASNFSWENLSYLCYIE